MNESKNPLDIFTTLDNLKSEIFSSLNCVKPGTIKSVNLSEGTAEIELAIKALIDNKQVLSYPILLDVPLFVLQGGGSFIDLPIEQGDTCLVLFNDRDIDNWWTTGNITTPNTTRKHSLSDGFALVGINTKSSALTRTGGPRVFTSDKRFDIVNNDRSASVLFQTLFDVIDALMDTLIDLGTVGTSSAQSLNPASIAALTARKSEFDAKKTEFDELYGGN